MRMSYSRVETFNQCPYKFYLSYIQGLKVYPSYEPADARIIGTALHTGIEKDVETAISEYYANYPIIDDKQIEEAIKLECVIEKARAVLPNGEYERKIEVEEPIRFIGFMDLLVPVGKDEEGEEWFDLYDFKYSNNIERYMESGQLHVYKHFFELANPGKHIRRMFFAFAPKVSIRLKKSETVEQFRLRLRSELEYKEVQVREVAYNEQKVKEFLSTATTIDWLIPEERNFQKIKSRLCDWCDYQRYCESDGKDDLDIDWETTVNDLMKNGVDMMQLPENKRREISKIDKKRIWLYGAPFSGKTYLANEFPDPLMLNTDGNVRFIDAPCIPIKDIVTVEGRITKRTYAWEVFKDAISELEKKDNTFKTIVVDLVEDTYEYCRQYMFNKLGIEHESDSGFGKGWDMIKTEFLNTIKRLMNLDYDNIVLISHEDTSKDLTKKSGDKITSIKPNIGDKPALKIAGMVDLVARVVNDNGIRTLSFKNNEYVFGGGRLNLAHITDIPCDYSELCKVYESSNAGNKPATKPVEEKKTVQAPTEPVKEEKPVESKETAPIEVVETATNEPEEETPEKPETPKRKRRKVVTEE